MESQLQLAVEKLEKWAAQDESWKVAVLVSNEDVRTMVFPN